jgi:hypothetical protein
MHALGKVCILESLMQGIALTMACIFHTQSDGNLIVIEAKRPVRVSEMIGITKRNCTQRTRIVGYSSILNSLYGLHDCLVISIEIPCFIVNDFTPLSKQAEVTASDGAMILNVSKIEISCPAICESKHCDSTFGLDTLS